MGILAALAAVDAPASTQTFSDAGVMEEKIVFFVIVTIVVSLASAIKVVITKVENPVAVEAAAEAKDAEVGN